MSELKICLAVVVVLSGLIWIRTVDPLMAVYVLLAMLLLINIIMTPISCAQAWRKNPKYLSGSKLGFIQIATGVALSSFFILLGEAPFSPAVIIASSFAGGGALVVIVSLISSLRHNRPIP